MSKPIRFAEPPLNTKSVLTNCLTSRKVISKSKGLVNAQKHLYLDTRTAKSMNRFLYEIATTACVLKHVLFVIDNKVRTIHGEGKQRIILTCNTPQSVITVERKHFIYLKLSMKNSFIGIYHMWETKSKCSMKM